MQLEKMDAFFEAGLDSYEAHMMSNIESAEEFYLFTAECLPDTPAHIFWTWAAVRVWN